ncbi:YihY family inner membrane protein [Alkanindiges sp. WGS2144]|uniref:YihY family inner membrane protein n=1 Tax=Alkanindiges sp. WGS2144 TaxID=3366808 RepID=UPI00375193DE
MLNLLEKLPFYHKTWFQFIIFIIKRFEDDKCRQQAGSLTYTTLFAVVPMLTVFLVIISSIKALAPAREQVQHFIYSNLLPRSGVAVEQYLNRFTESSSNLTVVGILILFVTAILMLSSIEDAFNHIWRVNNARGGIVGFMRYWTIISLGPILLGSAFALSSTVASMKFLSNNIAGYELNGGVWLWLISFALTLLGFSLLYWTIPNRRVPIRSAFLAGIFSALLFEGLRQFFGLVMSNFTSYELVYGAFAAVPIFLLWIYLSWNVILLGVEVSYAITAFTTRTDINRHPVLILLDLLELFYQHQKQGLSVSDQDALAILGRGEFENESSYLQILEDNNLIKRTEEGHYLLCRDLNYVDFWSFYRTLNYPLPKRDDLGRVHHDDRWLKVIGPLLVQSDDYLAAKLSIPMAKIFDVN